jgi:hypothetical protein
MTVSELIEALKRFEGTDLIVIQNDAGDYMPMTDRVVRARIGADGEHYHCAALGFEDCWPCKNGGAWPSVDYVLPEED